MSAPLSTSAEASSSSSPSVPIVQSDSFLTLHYRLAGPAGDVINTFTGKPATLSLDTGDLSPALQDCLRGLKEGTHTTFELPAGSAFGQRNPEMVQWVSKKLLAQLGDPQEQYQVGEVAHFSAPNGQGSYAGSVQRVDEEAVLFDFNHPLAGQPVTFEVKLIGVLNT